MTCVCKDRCAVDEYGSTVAPCKRVELDESGEPFGPFGQAWGNQDFERLADE